MKTETNTVNSYDMGYPICDGFATETSITGDTTMEILQQAERLPGDFFVGGFHFRNGKIWHDGWRTLAAIAAERYFLRRMTEEGQCPWLNGSRAEQS